MTLHAGDLNETATSTPEQLVAALTDFVPGRQIKVHDQGKEDGTDVDAMWHP